VLPGGVQRWIPVVIVSLAMLPFGWAAARLLADRRVRRGVPAALAWRRSWTEMVMFGGTLPWIWMTLTPLDAPRDVRLIPLVDLLELPAGGPAAVFFQFVGNLLVFAAFGFAAALRTGLRVAVIVALAASASIVVETLQYALALGRVSSVDDVLLNAAGAGLAAAAARRWAGNWSAMTPVGSVP
jgi:glycopeptide antibiotics resistance protein